MNLNLLRVNRVNSLFLPFYVFLIGNGIFPQSFNLEPPKEVEYKKQENDGKGLRQVRAELEEEERLNKLVEVETIWVLNIILESDLMLCMA